MDFEETQITHLRRQDTILRHRDTTLHQRGMILPHLGTTLRLQAMIHQILVIAHHQLDTILKQKDMEALAITEKV